MTTRGADQQNPAFPKYDLTSSSQNLVEQTSWPRRQVRNLRLCEASESPAQASQLVSRRASTGSEVSLILFAREEMVSGDTNDGSSEKALLF